MSNKTAVLTLAAVIIVSGSFWGWKKYYYKDAGLPYQPAENNASTTQESGDQTATTTVKSTTPPSAPTSQKVTLSGYVAISDSSRSFTPCNSERRYWITGSATNIKLLTDTYKRSVPNNPNSPVYAVMSGSLKTSTVSGYSKNFEITKITKIDALGSCQ